MACGEFPRTFDSPDEQSTLTKERLLCSLEKVASEVKKLGHVALQKEVQELQGHVRHVLENNAREIHELHIKIQNLEKEVRTEGEKNKKLQEEIEKQKDKNEKLENMFALAQATWAWEKHLARFVVDSSEKIYQSGWSDQMKKFLKKKPKHNRYTKIQDKLKKAWTDEHWRVVNNLRHERNCMAHPDLIDLDSVESEIEDMSPEDQILLEDMVEQLKMAASLMKFGRLTSYMFRLEGRNKRWNSRTMDIIISWDCAFEDIDGLQNVEHDEAKEYLTKFVDNPRYNNYYIFIVDSIKRANGERLGKLAWEIEDNVPAEYDEALKYLKEFLPDPDHKSKSPKDLNVTIAKLHVPDLLPKRLWKHGIEIVELYFHMQASLTKFGRLAKFYNTNKRLFSIPGENGEGMDARALKEIISWDRPVNRINGFQSIHHSEAKEYMAKKVNNPGSIDRYYFIVDFIKDENKKRLGKLACEIEASGILTNLSKTHRKALDELKKLLPTPKGERKVLDETIAKLHVPDFLPKHLWKHGIDILEKYFE